MKDGAWFPYMLVALLSASVIANILLIIRANSDPSFAVEPNYYQKAVDWDQTQAELRASEQLGWNMTVEARRAELRVQLSDRYGRPIDGATVAVEAFHNARANERVNEHLVPIGGGVYVLEHSFDRRGIWEMRLAAAVNDKKFTHVVKEEIE